MAKPKRKRKKSGPAGRPVASARDTALLELDKKVALLETAEPGAEGPIWGAIHQLLLKSGADSTAVGRIVATRDTAGLTRTMRILQGETVDDPVDAAPEHDPADDIPADELKKAMRAFRKRLKLVRLDHESKLGVGPMTGGKKADIDAILPPREFTDEVWEALASRGSLRNAGQGFYMLSEERS